MFVFFNTSQEMCYVPDGVSFLMEHIYVLQVR